VTPYAGAFVRYFVRNELSQLLPRKFKVAFSGSELDEAYTQIHDLGFIPVIRDVDGTPTKGFRVVAGGGLSIMAKHAVTLTEWVSVDDYLRLSEAVVRVFNGADELRKNLAKARIKFLVHRVGEAEFQRMVDEELTKDWAQHSVPPAELLFLDDEQAEAPPLPAEPARPPEAERAAFEEWARATVRGTAPSWGCSWPRTGCPHDCRESSAQWIVPRLGQNSHGEIPRSRTRDTACGRSGSRGLGPRAARRGCIPGTLVRQRARTGGTSGRPRRRAQGAAPSGGATATRWGGRPREARRRPEAPDAWRDPQGHS